MKIEVFCEMSSLGSRYDLTTPFVIGSWKYATDGRVAVRIPDDGLEEPSDPKRHVPNADKWFNDFPTCVHPWPTFIHDSLECQRCKGTGHRQVTCPSCDHEFAIAEKCIACFGNKVVLAPKGRVIFPYDVSVVHINGSSYNTWYLAVIESQLQNIRYSPRLHNEAGKLYFAADEGAQGILMSMYYNEQQRGPE